MCTNWRGRSSPAAYPIKSNAVNRVCSTVTRTPISTAVHQHFVQVCDMIMDMWLHASTPVLSQDLTMHATTYMLCRWCTRSCMTAIPQAINRHLTAEHANSQALCVTCNIRCVASCCNSKSEMLWWRAKCLDNMQNALIVCKMKQPTWRREDTKTRTGLSGECVCMAA